MDEDWKKDARAALTGIMANPERWKQIADDYKSGKKTYQQCSEANVAKACSLADEMEAERRRRIRNPEEAKPNFEITATKPDYKIEITEQEE